MQDTKWHFYLAYCNEFNFVAPKGVIRPDELPPEVGLYEVSVNSARLVQRKNAVYREVDIPEVLFRYILMCRARIVKEFDPSGYEARLRYWENWLESKREFSAIGLRVKKRIVDEMRDLRSENDRLKRLAASYDEIRHYLTLNKLSVTEPIPTYRLDKLRNDDEFKRLLQSLRNLVSNAESFLARATADGPA